MVSSCLSFSLLIPSALVLSMIAILLDSINNLLSLPHGFSHVNQNWLLPEGVLPTEERIHGFKLLVFQLVNPMCLGTLYNSYSS